MYLFSGIDALGSTVQIFRLSFLPFEQIHLVYRQDRAGVLRVDIRSEYPLLSGCHRACCASKPLIRGYSARIPPNRVV